ncbi:MAG: elongation factor G [Nitrospinae bacterium]|nr:elongation factor G [Nitrospinota bacterium]
MKSKDFERTYVRNVGLLSHSGGGKTSLAEAILFDTGEISRLGTVNDGTTALDYDPDETKRHISINTSLGFCEWKRHRLTWIDTPGAANFIADTYGALHVMDGAVVLVSAESGVKVQTERVWQWVEQLSIPRLVLINEMDHERANFSQALTVAQTAFDNKLVPVQVPLGEGTDFRGVIDLIQMRAFVYRNDLSGSVEEKDVPETHRELAQQYRSQLVERVAESNDELLEQYLERGELTTEELSAALRAGTLRGDLAPTGVASALRNIGIHPLLDLVLAFLPSPVERPPVEGTRSRSSEGVVRKPSEGEPFSALVFKTIADPYAGKLSLFRVCSGQASSDSVVYNATRDGRERIGQIFMLQGKTQAPVGAVSVGDIVAVAKLKTTVTGDSLCDERAPIIFPAIDFPKPAISFAVEPKSKADEEKVSQGLARLMEEDPSLHVSRDPQTRELLVSGLGEQHLEVVVDRLRRKFGCEVEMRTPRVPYKETIRSSTKVQGKHKRQSGGHGQYGDCWLEIESVPRGSGFEFVDKIVGGVIPRNFIPSVGKGVQEGMEHGPLAGYPMVDVRVTVYDGSFHAVDSSDMAFKIAGSLGFKKGVAQADPVLLEPIMTMEIVIPEEYMGDVIGDLNSRRGRVLGMDSIGASRVIRAQVPMAEVLRYASNLRSTTAGRGSFTMEFAHYEEVPPHLAERIITEAAREKEEKE